MRVRTLELADVDGRRLDRCFEAELRRADPDMVSDLNALNGYARSLFADGMERWTLVADTGAGQLAGCYLGIPATLPIFRKPILCDVFFAAVEPGAMDALVKGILDLARETGCIGFNLSCSWTAGRLVERWGRRYGAQPVTTVLHRRV